MAQHSPRKDSIPLQTSKRRNYQACLECKKHKVKCHLGDSEFPQPPCLRCRRARVPCAFGPGRKLKPRVAPKGASDGLPRGDDDDDQATYDSSETNGTMGTHGTDSQPPTSRTCNQSVSRTPYPDPNPGPDPDDAQPTDMVYCLSLWSHFGLCRNGQLQPHEADHLLHYFFRWMHPLYPLVDHTYSNSANWAQLIVEEALLCTTILVVASRYTWYHSDTSSSKAFEAHGTLYRHLQSQIQACIWVSPPGRQDTVDSLGLIESMMLLVEWHPRSMDLALAPRDIAETFSLENYGYQGPTSQDSTLEPTLESKVRHSVDKFKPLNIVSWRLLCMAVNVADELGIHQVITMCNDNKIQDSQFRRAHVREFLTCLVWERSYRLGRKCLINHSSNPSMSTDNEVTTDNLSSLLQCRAELYRLARLIENTLYASSDHTRDIINTTNYHSSIQGFAELLSTWKRQFDLVESVTPLRKHIQMTWHNTRLALFSISLRAVVARSKAAACEQTTPKGPNGGVKNISAQLQDQVSNDHDLIKQMVSDADQIIRLAMELDSEGLLRHVPINVVYHIASASLVLLRAQRLSLDISTDYMSLLSSVVEVLSSSSVDDIHASALFATLLKDILQSSCPMLNQAIIRAPNVVLGPRNKSISTEEMIAGQSRTGSSARISCVANSHIQSSGGILQGPTQDALLAFEFDEEWLGWMNV